MKILLALLAAVVVGSPAPHPDNPTSNAAGPAQSDTCFLFSYFVGNGEDGLHLAWSPDGYKWESLGGGKSFLKPQVGKGKLMRDPCLLLAPDGTFQLVWTDSGRSRTIGHASSKDLIHWSEQQAIGVMEHEPQAMNCWAPEVVFDEAKQQYLIFWSSTIPGRFPQTDSTGNEGFNHRIYATTTKDFKSFTPTRLFFDGGFNVIDATLIPAEGEYYLIVKDETARPVKKNLRIAVGNSPEGPFGEVSAPFTRDWVEGPSAIQVGDEYLVYFDCYRDHHYGAVRTASLGHRPPDLRTAWEDVSSRIVLPTGVRHGTALRVPKAIVARLASLNAKPTPAGKPANTAAPIDRQALVRRHNVVLDSADPNTALQVGNGEIAFGVDVTGLQTFYGNTMSHWGWHTFPLPPGKRIEDFKLTDFDTYGRPVGYPTSSRGQEEIYRWLRENPHRLNLGRLAMRLTAADGTPAQPEQIRQVHQELDLWRGLIETRFTFDGQAVRVETCADPTHDAMAVHIESPLVAQGRLTVELAFPYGSPGTSGADWQRPDSHQTQFKAGKGHANFQRQLDADRYTVRLTWAGQATIRESGRHVYLLVPGPQENVLECVCTYSPETIADRLATFSGTKAASKASWATFWNHGGAIDLSGSRDPRWKELERRIVLSQYLLAVQEAGSLPPQESGLFNNGWNGKFHLEMHWWHGAHYALWDRWCLLEPSLGWYGRILASARATAKQQGYRGARWPKMVGPEGRDSPSGIGPLLIWQQPHPIFYAQLDYRLHPTPETLKRWREIVFSTAEFMASYAVLDRVSGRYVLGPPLKTVPENNPPTETRDPAFELSYWRCGLRLAQQWRERLGLPREPEWDRVLNGLAPLPMAEGLYLQHEGLADTYTKWNWEHPSLVGCLGMLPGDGVDPTVMKATVRRVMSVWRWDRCWGWDFPMMAMAAARNGEPALAVEALLHGSKKNAFNRSGLSTGGPFPYFPSNGGLLYAAALMCAGWDGAPTRPAPGFPDDGTWTVRFEHLRPAP